MTTHETTTAPSDHPYRSPFDAVPFESEELRVMRPTAYCP